MKKSILSLILAVVFAFGATEGMVSAFASTEAKNDSTPVAKIENDDFKTRKEVDTEKLITDLESSVNALGGQLEQYSSEDEYYKAQAKKATEKNDSDVVTYSSEPVNKTIQVLDKKTAKPISNAIVRLNGIPRYTDRNGLVKAILTDSIYELYVEKNTQEASEQYNPHMEFIYLEDEEADTVKTIYLKHPSDDLEIYAVNLRIGSALSKTAEYYNLLEQEYHFALDYMDYPADIIIETNKAPDYSLLYVNGKLDTKTVGNDFLIFDYNRVKPDGSWWYSPDDEFSVSFVYEGIESKRYSINLGFTNLDDVIESEAMTYAENMARNSKEMSGGTDPSTDSGIGATFSFDLDEAIKYFYNSFKKSAAQLFKPKNNCKWGKDNGPVFSAKFDLRKNTITVIIGYEWSGSYKSLPNTKAAEEYNKAVDAWKKQKPERDALKNDLHTAQEELKTAKNAAEALKKYNRCEDRYREYIKNNNEGKTDDSIRNVDNIATSQYDDNKRILDSLTEQINSQKQNISSLKNQIKNLRKSVFSEGNKFLKGSFKFDFGFSITGSFVFDCKILKFSELTVTGKIKFGVSYTKHILVGYVPVYFRAAGSIEGGLKLKLVQQDEFGNPVLCDRLKDIVTLFVNISIRGDAGVGLYDFLSVGAFMQLNFDFQAKFKEDKNDDWSDRSYGRVGFCFGIRVKLIFFDIEIKFPNDVSNKKWEHYFYGGPDTNIKKDEEKSNLKIAARNVKNVSRSSENEIFDSVYQDTKPQLVNLGNERYLLVWLNDKATRDDLNRTELVYSIYQNGTWSEVNSVSKDSGLADLNPQVYQKGDSVYLTWQRFSSRISDTDSIADMSAKSEIYFAEFNNTINCFDNITRITNDDEMDFAPKFAVSSANDETITLLWQKNSSNDLLGLIGKNHIVSSTYKSGIWSTPEILYESESIVSYVTGSLDKGNLNVAFVEDVDKDLLTYEDRAITVLQNGNTIYSDTGNVGNTQFVVEDNKNYLYYFKENNIVKTTLTNFEIVANGNDGEFGSGFRVVSNNSGTTIFYDISNGQKKQSYCMVYDLVAKKWNKNVVIGTGVDNTSNSIGFISETGKIVYSFLRSDDEQTYTRLDFGIKELSYRLKIESAFSLDNIVDGKSFELDLNITNTGDFEINEFNVELFGQTQNVILETPLAVGQSTILTLNFVAETNNNVYEIITVTAILNSNAVCKDEYLFYFGYVDYELEATFVEENGDVFAVILIEKLNQYYSSGKLYVYINEKEYEILELTNICEIDVEQVIKIKLDDVAIGDIIRMELITDTVDKCNSNNKILTLSDRSSYKYEPFVNPYITALDFAKNIV